MTFFNRRAAIDVELKSGEVLRIENLRVEFDVQKENKAAANKASIRVYNLSENSRSKIRERDAFVRVFCGYEGEGGAGLVFVGNAQFIFSQWETPDIVTIIEAQDGIKTTRESRTSFGYGPGTSAQTVLNRIIGDMDLIPRQSFNASGTYPNGYAFNGRCRDALDEVCGKFGLTWSVVDNQIQILPTGGSTNRVYLLSPETGLINTPERLANQDGDLDGAKRTEAEWKLTCLMNPNLNPGDRVEIRSRQAAGIFRIDKLQHVGDTRGSDWYTIVEVRGA
jgi:hypothetical protein